MAENEIESMRKRLADYNLQNSLMRHNPSGNYYVRLEDGLDVEHKGRHVTVMRAIPSSQLWVMSTEYVFKEVDVDGVMKPRFSPAIDDDRAMEVLVKYVKDGFRF